MSFAVEHVNPEGMRRSPAFTNVISVRGPHTRVIIGALDPVDENGQLVGEGDIVKQTEQIFTNLDLCLKAVGARLSDIVIFRIFVLAGQSVEQGASVFMRVWDRTKPPPANTVVFVPALGRPGSLVTLEAEAVIATVE